MQNASFPASAATDGNTGTRWSSAFSDPQWLEVDLGSTQSICKVVLNWEAAYATAFQIQTSTDGTTWTTDLLHHHRHRRHPDPQRLRHRPVHPHVRNRPRHPVRLLAVGVPGLRPTGGGGGTCGTTNVALNKTATASSTENAGVPGSNAVDGNTGTRWSSAFSDPQWLEVDLGSTQSICKVVLDWEAAYATAFQIQTSTDGTTWTTIYSTTTGTGGTQTLNVIGHRPLHPDVRNRTRHPVRLLAVGVRGLRDLTGA